MVGIGHCSAQRRMQINLLVKDVALNNPGMDGFHVKYIEEIDRSRALA
jgi:hypothetical protein